MTKHLRHCTIAALTAWTLTLSGCTDYKVEGYAVQSDTPGIYVTATATPDDPSRALAEVRIEVIRDPQSLGRESVGQTVTDGQGRFTLPLDYAGAGFLEEDVLIIARRRGYEPTRQIIPMPAESAILRIEMSPGVDRLDQPMSPEQQIERFMN